MIFKSIYRKEGFMLIFLTEYSRIVFMKILFCVIFWGSDVNSHMFYWKLRFVSFICIYYQVIKLRPITLEVLVATHPPLEPWWWNRIALEGDSKKSHRRMKLIIMSLEINAEPCWRGEHDVMASRPISCAPHDITQHYVSLLHQEWTTALFPW